MTQEPIIFEVEPGEFDEKVVAASSRTTVVVDFWAPWCGPCRMLTPVLEGIVTSMGGRARLAKVNVDEHQEVAARFNVQGIPAVKVFRGGEVVAEFVGALPEAQVRRVLEKAIPSAGDELVEQADTLLGSGDREEARRRYRQVLDGEPRHYGAALRLARLALEDGQLEEARRLASLIGEDAEEHAEAAGLLARVGFLERCRDGGGLWRHLAGTPRRTLTTWMSATGWPAAWRRAATIRMPWRSC